MSRAPRCEPSARRRRRSLVTAISFTMLALASPGSAAPAHARFDGAGTRLASMKMPPRETTGQAAQEAQPSDLTSRGNIAASASEAYRTAIESCYHGPAGSAPHGAQFVACLKRSLRTEAAALESAYGAAVTMLRSAADRLAHLRRAQRAWLDFKNENCAFARTAAPRGDEDEFYYDCELRSTIDRRVELRSLVGD